MEEAGIRPDDMLTPKQVSELLGRHLDTLHCWRARKIGPPFIRLVGRIYYRSEDINAWLEAGRTDTIG